ncbi:hypothetical protein B566_EDAN009954 [Ephemera danica]|nr:hypothetical protein B566_EDAN009954 [Ephemera danica]
MSSPAIAACRSSTLCNASLKSVLAVDASDSAASAPLCGVAPSQPRVYPEWPRPHEPHAIAAAIVASCPGPRPRELELRRPRPVASPPSPSAARSESLFAQVPGATRALSLASPSAAGSDWTRVRPRHSRHVRPAQPVVPVTSCARPRALPSAQWPPAWRPAPARPAPRLRGTCAAPQPSPPRSPRADRELPCALSRPAQLVPRPRHVHESLPLTTPGYRATQSPPLAWHATLRSEQTQRPPAVHEMWASLSSALVCLRSRRNRAMACSSSGARPRANSETSARRRSNSCFSRSSLVRSSCSASSWHSSALTFFCALQRASSSSSSRWLSSRRISLRACSRDISRRSLACSSIDT